MKFLVKSLFLLTTLAAILHLNSCRNFNLLNEQTKIPDYKGITTSNDTVHLYDYLGENIVLVNFWAGWCGDCLEHNPELVALYDKYKDFEIDGRHFDIVSISLDKNKTQWQKNITRQNLSWNNHIADMDGYDSEQLKNFKITWIPTNYLVDENGIIIARNVDRTNFENVIHNYYNE